MYILDDKDLMSIRRLRIENIYGNERVVKFQDAKSYGTLCVWDVLSAKAFRNIICWAQHFLKPTRPKLDALRMGMNSMILKSLNVLMIKRLARVNASTKNYLWSMTFGQHVTDITLAKCLRGIIRDLSKNDQTIWLLS